MQPLPCKPACLQERGQKVAAVYRSTCSSPFLVALPNQPSSLSQLQPARHEHSGPVPDHACFGGLEEGLSHSSSMLAWPWPPTCLISQRASSYLPSSSLPGPTHSSAPAPSAPAPAAEAESQLWSLEIGLPLETSAREVSRERGTLAGADGDDSTLLDAEDASRREWQSDMLYVLGWLLPHTPLCKAQGRMQGVAAADELDVAQVYAAVKPSGAEPLVVHDPPELRPCLRVYQRKAVAWMLQREHAPGFNSQQQQQQQQGLGSSEPPLHPLFRRVNTLGGRPPFFVNPYTGHVLHRVRRSKGCPWANSISV
eukprot:245078-Pelagomonas_calceolata.AAC.2